ncbi:serine hydrolase domain-containing protein [Kitasatospora nipponensis]|uniref:Serine hydrolase domain-containing protein n=1 Tax=Kitasatospora nipponensis TaxID=258049 RepID=A0ABN1VLY4_9ACTN
MQSLRMIEDWPVPTAAVAVVRGADGALLGSHGPQRHRFPLASVTKMLAAYAALVAVEEGVFELDDPAGPAGSTVRHLLAHTSGLAFDDHRTVAEPGTRRLYSNAGFDVLAETLAKAAGIPFERYVAEAVFEPLGMADSAIDTTHRTPAGAGGVSTAADLAAFAAELQAPRLLDPSTLTAATRQVAFPGLTGVLPGFGHQRPNDWGLGFEIRDHKAPHWTGATSSPATFGHFGQSGTFLWVDPQAGAACVALADRDFGPWAAEAWPPLTDAVLAELRASAVSSGPPRA